MVKFTYEEAVEELVKNPDLEFVNEDKTVWLVNTSKGEVADKSNTVSIIPGDDPSVLDKHYSDLYVACDKIHFL